MSALTKMGSNRGIIHTLALESSIVYRDFFFARRLALLLLLSLCAREEAPGEDRSRRE